MQMDEILAGVADKIKNWAVIYLVDITEVRHSVFVFTETSVRSPQKIVILIVK